MKQQGDKMNEVVKFLEENPVQYLATVGLDGKAKVRPFMFMLERKGKLYYCTSNQKPVFKEISNSPHIELTTASPEFAWIRISAKVVFSDDMDIKKAIIEKSEIVKSQYQTADNPTLEIFYLEGKVKIADFSGEPPKEFTL